MTTDDMELVRQYAARQSESAFATLVSRHASLVYSAALRQARDPQLAEEITQAVFIILARKAGSLNEKTILPGWLYRAACYTANSARKQEHRRQQREQEAYMQSTLQEARIDAAWKQMSPLLEEAMLRLGQTDRDALVLRFFEGRSLNEVGAALGASEDAAKMRVNRALEKLRKFFTKRGVSATTAIIAGAISANSIQAAPAALAKSVMAVALAKGAAASGSTLTLVKGALKIMAWTKAKTAIAVGVGVLFVAGTVATGSLWGWFAHKEIPFEAQG
ncbi:MAG TPA: sigma-70 family RNA polymerase sigma factor, partial [Candidatus Limnocylindrales bacterium]|nr:sigma-70 family RNA polymerase sigma factor [Candidatus Limnocylindrales bacterium]